VPGDVDRLARSGARWRRMNVPMALTIGRLFLAPVYFVLFHVGRSGNEWLVGSTWAVFVLIEVSDLLDGHLARKLRLESEAGRVLDPLADSVSRLTYFVCFTGSGIMPAWILLVLVYRDVGVSYIRVMLSRSGVMMPARMSGKVKAWVYAVSGGAGTAVFTVQALDILAEIRDVLNGFAFVMFLAAAGVALWSLGDYALALLHGSNDEKKRRKSS
jgi:CDP-diacylglycerol--glycerol-3-phosphate 3-phosphatidyltransferase